MKIMIADSSAVVRTILEQNLLKYEQMQITASVSSCKKILLSLESEKADVIICGNDITDDTEKESVNKICKELKIPVLLLCSSDINYSKNTYTEIMEKPNLKNYTSDFFERLKDNLHKLTVKQQKPKAILASDNDKTISYKILCIGASTGGPTAVAEVLCGLGNNFSLPILYTQHIDINKDKELVTWLNGVCKNVFVKLASDGEKAKPGIVYMAPADRHLVISHVTEDGIAILELSDDEPEHYLKPAVNKLFKSAANKYKNKTLAILLTGMGADGASGCKEICDNGGWTIVEDKSTCAVFGMPAAAIEAGGAKEVLPRQEISKRILELAGLK